MPPTNTRGLMTSRMDILDRPDHYKVSVELPGVSRDDIRVHLDGNRLYLEAHKSEEHTGEGERVYLSERSYGAIRRTVEMPGSVDPTKVKAEFDNGLLKVYVGKKESLGELQGQMIPIQ
ncbi:Heat shock protein Hsp20 [Paramicrosporidium saccamoebae]|uniref:Heat shock protein Hsp20 n=1 Tax=Paramicrosporidium saccamoebae TaxID=1246581 RepID=A0A2H9TLZ4_9FUNG|nr:Heat shock protein Hsp20 [Paramicrosporidium saccamoebae]